MAGHAMGGDPLRSGFEDPGDYGFETRAVRAGQPHDPRTGAVVTPINLSTTFAQDAVGDDHNPRAVLLRADRAAAAC